MILDKDLVNLSRVFMVIVKLLEKSYAKEIFEDSDENRDSVNMEPVESFCHS